MYFGSSAGEGRRMLCELASLSVTCGHCDKTTVLGFEELQAASFAGAYNYARLCGRLVCSECTGGTRSARRLQFAPAWRAGHVIA